MMETVGVVPLKDPIGWAKIDVVGVPDVGVAINAKYADDPLGGAGAVGCA